MLLLLSDLRFHAFHGCLPQERSVGNDYTLDLELILPDNPLATEHDDLKGTVNYAEIADFVAAIMEESVNLLEHLANKICTALLVAFPIIEYVRIKLCKIAPPMPHDIAKACVVVEKQRSNI